MALFIALPDFVADDAASDGSADRSDSAAAGHRGSGRAAERRAADRADGFACAAAARHAEGRCERDTHNDKDLAHALPPVVKMANSSLAQLQPRNRKITNSTGMGTPSAQSRI